MTNKPNLNDRFRYAFDNFMSRGTVAIIIGLAFLSVTMIVVVAAIISYAGIGPGDATRVTFFEAVWLSLMRTLDAGTMGGDEGWYFRLTMFVVTLGGVFVISTLIGALTSGIESKMEDLRKGKSRVIENQHTVILGWSEQIFTIVSEIVAANENQSRGCVVILAERDKVAMEEELREKVRRTGKTRIVCRTGSPMEITNLELVSLDTAKSIIVISGDVEDPDPDVIKTVLAITNHPHRKVAPYHIVAELHDPKNDDVARIIGKDEVEWVQVGDLAARVIAQTCRQSGLSVIYIDLLDFGGDEIYFTEQPPLVGKTYGEALFAFEKNAVIGLVPADGFERDQGPLNPSKDKILQAGDKLIVIAEDDDKIFLDGQGSVAANDVIIQAPNPVKPEKENTLLLGWNWRGPAVIRELDNYVAKGSEVMVVADVDSIQRDLEEGCPILKNQKVVFQRGDTTNRRVLDKLRVENYNHIVVLSYKDVVPQTADSRTLVTLLHLRDIAEKKKGKHFSIVSEMIDIRNRDLAEATRADDFIVSNKLVSLILAQVSENKALNTVFQDLFDPEGAEIYLKPAMDYVALGVPVNFYTIIEGARRVNETAFGYRLAAYSRDAEQQYGIRLNPLKSEVVSFSAEDKIIVLAEN